MKCKLLLTLLMTATALSMAFGLAACGEPVNGKNGTDGKDGESAYEIWLENGHNGTEADFLEWLKGEDGKDGKDGTDGKDGADGRDGKDGTDGKDGQNFTACEHTYMEWKVAIEATCTSIGYSTRECTICGDMEYTFHEATGHEWNDGRVMTAPSCEESGFALYACNVCKTVKSEEIPATEHNYEGGVCTECGAYIPDRSGLEFTLNEDGESYCVTGIGTASGNVVIPEIHFGLPVTAIGDSAFRECASLTGIVVPKSVTAIGDFAFRECKNLTYATLSDGVTELPNQIFYYCTALENVILPNGLTKIGMYAFYECSITSIVIPKSLNFVNYFAFAGCRQLKSVYITDLAAWCALALGDFSNPLSYGADLYLSGELITDLVIPEGVPSIGQYAFYNANITSVRIPASVTEIGEFAFLFCSSLEHIEVAQDNPVYHSAGNCLIDTKQKLLICGSKTSVIPNDGSVSVIGEMRFPTC